jgi:putative sigma-54 modulation protein
MQLQIEIPHAARDEKLGNLVRSKFEHLGKRYERIFHCDVVLREEKSDIQKYFFVEAKMEVPQKTLFASEKAESFEMALDKVLHDLEHQLSRFKEELEERR